MTTTDLNMQNMIVPIGSATFTLSHTAAIQAQAQKTLAPVPNKYTSKTNNDHSNNDIGSNNTNHSQIIDENETSKIVITKINAYDVLCGRGGETNQHTGNVRFRSLVRDRQVAYLRARRGEKPKISEYIVNQVHRNGGRFLKRVEGSPTNQYRWMEVSDQKAREKTSQALREKAPEIRKAVAVHHSGASDSVSTSSNYSILQHSIHDTTSHRDIHDVSSLFGATCVALNNTSSTCNPSPCPWTTNIIGTEAMIEEQLIHINEPDPRQETNNPNSSSCDAFEQLCLPSYFAYNSPNAQNSFSNLVSSSSVDFSASTSPVIRNKKRCLNDTQYDIDDDEEEDSSDQNDCDSPTRGPRLQLLKRRSSVGV